MLHVLLLVAGCCGNYFLVIISSHLETKTSQRQSMEKNMHVLSSISCRKRDKQVAKYVITCIVIEHNESMVVKFASVYHNVPFSTDLFRLHYCPLDTLRYWFSTSICCAILSRSPIHLFGKSSLEKCWIFWIGKKSLYGLPMRQSCCVSTFQIWGTVHDYPVAIKAATCRMWSHAPDNIEAILSSLRIRQTWFCGGK